MKILLADDDELALDMLEHVLVSHGYEVIKATNGTEAVGMVLSREARLVITDWEMPGISGVELCKLIRQGDVDGYVYTILLTGRNQPESVVEGMRAGADDFIIKPFNPNELLARVRAGERVLSLETRDVMIFALARLAESRDKDTGMHLERVQNLSRLLAEKMATYPEYQEVIDRELIRLIFLTSPLHDIGKVGIPDSILLKPGKLTEDEYRIMKLHVEIGSSTLADALNQSPGARFLEVARDIAACHHEKWDGTGYPQGLIGLEIPLAARIVALADVYDALRSERVYKTGFSHTKTKDIIVSESSKHFDPDVVRAFLECEDEILSIVERYKYQGSARPIHSSAVGEIRSASRRPPAHAGAE